MNHNKSVIYDTPLGYICIEHSDLEVYSIKFCEANECSVEGVHTPLADCVIEQIIEYFEGQRTSFTFDWRLQGTEFQMRVWCALCDIPYGERRTYKDIAITIGSPRASRAVGAACNRNPMMIIVPCHRVVGADGGMVGYAGGVDLKKQLLDIEGVIVPSPLL